MEVLKIEVVVAKDTYELGKAVYDFINTCKKSLDDGWQVGNDLPVIVTSALTQFLPGLQGFENISKEWENKEAFVNAVMLTMGQIPFLWIKSDVK